MRSGPRWFSGSGSGSSMQAGAPAAARSNDDSRGPMSSHVARRLGPVRGGGSGENSGGMKGLASWRATTERGTTERSTRSSVVAAGGSTASSRPEAAINSRLRARVELEISASSVSSMSSAGSRVAVLARMVATPSSRLSWSARCGSVRSAASDIGGGSVAEHPPTSAGRTAPAPASVDERGSSGAFCPGLMGRRAGARDSAEEGAYEQQQRRRPADDEHQHPHEAGRQASPHGSADGEAEDEGTRPPSGRWRAEPDLSAVGG